MPRIHKPDANFRSATMLDLAAKAPCCMVPSCGTPNVGNVVGAHSNLQIHGKGTGLKADDLVAFLCERCHDLYDGRSPGWDETRKELEWGVAFVRSMRWLFSSGYAMVFRTPLQDRPR